jgi:ADP-heptose:LPS heptosyltransferase
MLRDHALSLINIIFDSALILLNPPPKGPEAKKLVLVVRLDAIGDFVLWLNAAEALKTIFPADKYRLVLLGNVIWKDLAEHCNFFDEYIFVDTEQLFRNIRYRLNVWKRIRNRTWTYAIQPAYSREINCGDSAVRVSGAPHRIGSAGDSSNQLAVQKIITNRWFTRLVPAMNEPLMELERNAEFIRNLGLSGFKANLPKLALPIQLPAGFVANDYVVIVPGASLPLKCWPLENFAALCKRIHDDLGFKIIICGGSNETIMGQKLLSMTTGINPSSIEDWTGRTSLVEFASIVKRARLLIGNDSSAVHIAVASGTPAVCIVGGGHFGRFIPYRVEVNEPVKLPLPVFHSMNCYGCNLKCLYDVPGDSAGPCISSISVDHVWEAILKCSADSSVDSQE